jgi:hypothetical protein
MIIRTTALLGATVWCAFFLATPVLAVDGEILINQAAVNAGDITPGDTPGYPATLSRPGRYKLNGNLVAPAATNGIEITAKDVALDLNGFTIRNAVPGSSARAVFALTGADRVRVSNGTITGFGNYGILILGMNGVVEDMRILNNFIGIQLSPGTGGRVRNSTIANNTSNGMYCYGCLVQGNIIAGNGNTGLADTNKGGGTIIGNIIVGNTGYGIVAPDPPLPKTGYGNNILTGNNSGGLQALGIAQIHPNLCEPACP